MTPANFVAYAGQVAIVVLACAGLPRLLGLRAPGVQYAFWRTVLAVCLLLPVVQPWQPGVMTFVPRGGQSGPFAPTHPEFDLPAGAPVAPPFDWVAAATIVIPIGIAARLGWIGLGMIRLGRTRRRATEAAVGFDDLQHAIGTTAPIFWSGEVRHPVTFGVLEPVVLLPIALRAAELPAQRAVVAHELNHVRRRDWAWVVAEEVVRSVFWFHPGIWWLVSRVQLARETVVDELSILVTNARRTYLDTLLAFADDTGLASSPAFSARRHLFHRVMLLSGEGQMSSRRVAIASCVLVLALGVGTVEAVRAFPLYAAAAAAAAPAPAPVPQEPTPVGDPQPPPRDQQYRGHRVDFDFQDADLRAVLRAFASENRLNVTIDPQVEGRVNILLHDVPWDQAFEWILQANKLGYTVEGSMFRIAPLSVLGGKQSQEDKDKLRQRVMLLEKSRPFARGVPGDLASRENDSPAPPPPSPEYEALIAQYQPVRIGGGIKTPPKVRDIKPAFPPLAQTAGVQGVVIVEALVDSNGDVVDARLLRSIPLLDEAALSAVKQWRFSPTLLNGSPVAVLMTVTVNFSLQQ